MLSPGITGNCFVVAYSSVGNYCLPERLGWVYSVEGWQYLFFTSPMVGLIFYVLIMNFYWAISQLEFHLKNWKCAKIIVSIQM